MNSLFESISVLNIDNDFGIQFKILGIDKGYEIIDKLECEEMLKRQLVKYVAYAYSIDSPLLRKKKERQQNIENILLFLRIEHDDFVDDCVCNRNEILNSFTTWWLRESKDRDIAMLMTAEDLLYQLLEVARSGVNKVVTAKDERQVEKAMKLFYKSEVILRADAYERAMEVRDSIEKQTKILERNYEYLSGIVKKELPNSSATVNWQEQWAHRNTRKK